MVATDIKGLNQGPSDPEADDIPMCHRPSLWLTEVLQTVSNLIQEALSKTRNDSIACFSDPNNILFFRE